MANMGSGSVLAWGKESVWGAAVVDTALYDFASESISAEPQKTKADSLVASKAASAYDLMGIKVGGDGVIMLRPESAGPIFKAAMGGTDVVTVVTTQQCHTIPLAAAGAAFPSYTIFANRKQAIKKYSGMKVAVMKLAAKVGDYARVTLTWKGKDEATATIATSTMPSLKHYKFIGATVTAGGQALDVSGIELTIDNGMDDGLQLNTSGLYRSEPLHGERKVTIKIDMPYDANSETIRETNLKAETLLSSVVIHLESPSIIATTYKYHMDLTLNNVAVLSAPVNVGGPGVIMCSISGEATSVGATEPMVAAIYDATAGAY